MKHLTYTPKGGVCTRQIDIEMEDDVIRKVVFTGGCSGNTQGISHLVAGMRAEQVIQKLRHIDCKGKGTSCPDQLAQALEQNV